MLKIGDLVKVETKFHGEQLGIIIDEWDRWANKRAWIVHIPGHWTSSTLVPEADMRLVV